MCDQMNLQDIGSAISSQVLVVGRLHCASQDGRMIERSGQEAAHANLSARQAKEKDLLTSGTYGRRGFISSITDSLQLYLENRLQQQLNTDGSILFKQTWKQRTTPLGRRFLEHTASVLRTNDSDYGSLPTPSGTSNHGKNHVAGRLDEWGGEQPLPWNEPWQRALSKFRALDDGLSYGVDAVDTPRNAIVSQVAAAFIEAYLRVSE